MCAREAGAERTGAVMANAYIEAISLSVDDGVQGVQDADVDLVCSANMELLRSASQKTRLSQPLAGRVRRLTPCRSKRMCKK